MFKEQLSYPRPVRMFLHLSILLLDLVNRDIESFLFCLFKLKHTVQKLLKKNDHSNKKSVSY